MGGIEKLMTFLARIIRFLFWIVIVSWGVRLLGRTFSGLLQANTPPAPLQPADNLHAPQAARLVRDPVCGVHIAEVLALQEREQVTMRIAANMLGVGRVVEAVQTRGIYP